MPFGLTPIAITFAPNDLNNSGPALYPAPFAQSITILKPLKLNSFVKFFFKIFKYSFVPLSNLFTRPSLSGLERFFIILLSINFSIFFSILSDSFMPSGPNNFNPLS